MDLIIQLALSILTALIVLVLTIVINRTLKKSDARDEADRQSHIKIEKKLSGMSEAILDISKDLKSHRYHSLKKDIKTTYRDVKSRIDNKEKIGESEARDILDLVESAQKYLVNKETTPMQEYLLDVYYETLRR